MLAALIGALFGVGVAAAFFGRAIKKSHQKGDSSLGEFLVGSLLWVVGIAICFCVTIILVLQIVL